MLQKKVLIIVILGFLAALIPGCKKSAIVPLDPEGSMLSYNGCKQTLADRSTGGIFTPQAVQECIVFRYDGEKTLEIDHTNALFNCCPGEITAGFAFNGNTITITEIQAQAGCHCICHFDVNVQLDNISPAVYTIRIIAGDVNGKDREFSIDLTADRNGTQCWDSPYFVISL